MSLAYPVKKIEINEVSGLEDLKVFIGAVLQTGNLLFRSSQPGAITKKGISGWASGTDVEGRVYLFWRADHPRGGGLVVQPMDSYYCFEVFPA